MLFKHFNWKCYIDLEDKDTYNLLNFMNLGFKHKYFSIAIYLYIYIFQLFNMNNGIETLIITIHTNPRSVDNKGNRNGTELNVQFAD